MKILNFLEEKMTMSKTEDHIEGLSIFGQAEYVSRFGIHTGNKDKDKALLFAASNLLLAEKEFKHLMKEANFVIE